MKRKNLAPILLAVAMLALPALSLASTYQFIDTGGNLQSVEANSSSVALATAYQLGVHSGVVLVQQGTSVGVVLGTNTTTTGTGNYYQFVDSSGRLQGVWATSSSVALATAYQLGVHSGVVLVK